MDEKELMFQLTYMASVFENRDEFVTFIAKHAHDKILSLRKELNGYVSELCPHCSREATIEWNVEQDGYKAYCPYCSKRLMLCSMCPNGNSGCDFDRETDSCKYNPKYHVKEKQ